MCVCVWGGELQFVGFQFHIMCNVIDVTFDVGFVFFFWTDCSLHAYLLTLHHCVTGILLCGRSNLSGKGTFQGSEHTRYSQRHSKEAFALPILPLFIVCRATTCPYNAVWFKSIFKNVAQEDVKDKELLRLRRDETSVLSSVPCYVKCSAEWANQNTAD